jgi:hypothetical protein
MDMLEVAAAHKSQPQNAISLEEQEQERVKVNVRGSDRLFCSMTYVVDMSWPKIPLWRTRLST